MSNWSAYHQIGHPPKKIKRSKGFQLHFILSVLLLIGSASLVWFTIKSNQGMLIKHDSKNPHSAIFSSFSPTVQYWAEDILSWSEDWSLDPLLIATVMQIESCGNPEAISPAGAHGLFQVMPFHFDADEDMLNAQINAQRGLCYLSQSYEKAGGIIPLTLAGYNGGHGQINRDANLWPEETKRYVQYGSEIYEDAANGNPRRVALNTWLEAGGALLCQQAEVSLDLD